MIGFVRRGQPISVFVPGVGFFGPGWQLVALIDGGLQAAIQLLEFGAEMRFYAYYGIEAANQRLRGVMKNLAQSLARGERPFGSA
jgi:hypothetical protein